MNKFWQTLDKITGSKAFAIVISVVIALIAWFSIVSSTNPIIERTYDVDVDFTNFDGPAAKKLTLVSDLGVVSSQVKVSGRTKLLDSVSAADLELEADFGDIKEAGQYYIKIKPKNSKKIGVNIVDFWPKEISVTYDTKMEMYLPVRANFDEKMLKNGYEIVSVTTEPDALPISGFASAIENIEYIGVNLSDNVAVDTVDGDKTLTLLGRYITKTGNDITANFDTEKVTVKIDVAKRIPVTFSTAGTPAEDCYIKDVTVSHDNVLVDGISVREINEIKLGSIDIDGADGDIIREFRLSDFLPGDVKPLSAADSTIIVTVEIEHLETREFKIPTDSVALSGKDADNFNYTNFDWAATDGKGNIRLRLKGRPDRLDQIKTSDLKATVEMPTKQGSYPKWPVIFTVDDDIEIVGEYFVGFEMTPVQTATLPPETSNPTAEPTAAPTDAATVPPAETESTISETVSPTALTEISDN